MQNRLLILTLILTSPLFSRARTSGYCTQGGQVVVTAFVSSSTKVMQSYPQCVVTVFLSGSVTKATLYSDNTGTPLGNPFTSAKTGAWFYYVDNGPYDVSLSGGGIPVPFTIGAVSSIDPFNSFNGSSPKSLGGTNVYQFMCVFSNGTGTTSWAFVN